MRRAIVLALFTLLGCRGAGSEATQPQVVTGAYALATIAGAPLPAQYPLGLSITSSRLVVLSAGTWAEARSGILAGKVENLNWGGTWTQSGSDLEFRAGPTTLYTGVATSSGLKLSSGGTAFAYSRE
jgi:hypothetical protein